MPTPKRIDKKVDGWLLAIMAYCVFMGTMYIVLLLPMMDISVLGIPAASIRTWGPLTWFEMFWQPITAGFYITAAIMIWQRKNLAKVFTKVAISCTVVEALVLNIGLVWITRRGIMNDGIFQNSDIYSLSKALFFIGFSVSALWLITRYFDTSKKTKEVLTK
ncbi:hypothetical protein FWF48_03970 [Candidatus Saccharibacteria bacterium]|nr:hypothetical protein [Candidatus Saccharibacteria bacterium]